MKKPVKRAVKKKPPTAADLLLKAKRELEDRIGALCKRFEEKTGLKVRRIAHPHEPSDYGRGIKGGRVSVFVLPPEEAGEVNAEAKP